MDDSSDRKEPDTESAESHSLVKKHDGEDSHQQNEDGVPTPEHSNRPTRADDPPIYPDTAPRLPPSDEPPAFAVEDPNPSMPPYRQPDLGDNQPPPEKDPQCLAMLLRFYDKLFIRHPDTSRAAAMIFGYVHSSGGLMFAKGPITDAALKYEAEFLEETSEEEMAEMLYEVKRSMEGECTGPCREGALCEACREGKGLKGYWLEEAMRWREEMGIKR